MWKKSLSRNCLQGENLICFVTALSPRNENIWREFLNCHHFPRMVSIESSLSACARPRKWRERVSARALILPLNQNFPRHKFVTLQRRARSKTDKSSSSEVHRLRTFTLYCRRRHQAHWFLYNQGLSVTYEMELCTSSEFTSSAILPNFKVVLRDLRSTRAKFCSYCISEQHLKGDFVFVFAKKS